MAGRQVPIDFMRASLVSALAVEEPVSVKARKLRPISLVLFDVIFFCLLPIFHL